MVSIKIKLPYCNRMYLLVAVSVVTFYNYSMCGSVSRVLVANGRAISCWSCSIQRPFEARARVLRATFSIVANRFFVCTRAECVHEHH